MGYRCQVGFDHTVQFSHSSSLLRCRLELGSHFLWRFAFSVVAWPGRHTKMTVSATQLLSSRPRMSDDPNDLYAPAAPGDENQAFQQFDDILTAALAANQPAAEETTTERPKRRQARDEPLTLQPRAQKAANVSKAQSKAEALLEMQEKRKAKEAKKAAREAAKAAKEAKARADGAAQIAAEADKRDAAARYKSAEIEGEAWEKHIEASNAAMEAWKAKKLAEMAAAKARAESREKEEEESLRRKEAVPRVSEPPTPQPMSVQEMMDRLNQTTTQFALPPTDDLSAFDAQTRNTAAHILPASHPPGPLPSMERIRVLSNIGDAAINTTVANAVRARQREEEGFRPYGARLMDMEQALRRETNPYAAAHEMALDRARQALARLPPAPPRLNVIDVDPQASQQQQANRKRPSATPLPASVAPRGSVLRSNPAHSTPSPAAVAAAAGFAAAALNARNQQPSAESAAGSTPAQLSATSQILISPNAPTPQQPMESASTALAVSNPTAHHMTVPSAVRMCDTSLDINPTQWTLLHKAAFEMIEQSLPNLSPSERSEICDAFYKITHKKNGKGNKPKEPKLEALNRVALRAAELEANRMRVVFGEKMRAIRKHRHGLVHHSNGGYTAQMAAAPRVVPVQPGQSIRTRGWVQRDKGYIIRRVQRQAKASVVGPLGNKKRANAAAIAANNRAQIALGTLQAVAAGREAQQAALENMNQG